jgi:uncharacterized protein
MITAICFLSLFLIASPSKSSAAESIQHIYDEAGLLSTDEINELEQMCTNYGEDAGFTIIIMTHNDPNSKDGEIYIEDFYDKMVYGDSVILLVDLFHRDVILEGYGLAEKNLNSKRGDVIIEKITPYLSEEEYASAFELYIKRSAAYMKDDYTGPESILSNALFQLLSSLILGGIIVGIMVYNSGGKMTAGGNNYIDGGHSGLIGRRDDYIRTTVTRVRKPTQNSGGGFKGGISGGGHSHSTSRGKF